MGAPRVRKNVSEQLRDVRLAEIENRDLEYAEAIDLAGGAQAVIDDIRAGKTALEVAARIAQLAEIATRLAPLAL